MTTARFDGIEPFNLADHVGPGRSDAIENRRRLCRRLGMDFSRLTLPEQIHRGNVAMVTERVAGHGRSGRDDSIVGCDGLITDLADTPLMCLSADCPLVVMFEPRQAVLAVLHVSWRALVDGIIAHAVERLVCGFACRPDEVYAGIGPSAGVCCYEVGEEFCEQIASTTPFKPFLKPVGDTQHFDLCSAICFALMRAGVRDDRIETAGMCTICDERYFSYRREGRGTGRFGLVAMIREK